MFWRHFYLLCISARLNQPSSLNPVRGRNRDNSERPTRWVYRSLILTHVFLLLILCTHSISCMEEHWNFVTALGFRSQATTFVPACLATQILQYSTVFDSNDDDFIMLTRILDDSNWCRPQSSSKYASVIADHCNYYQLRR